MPRWGGVAFALIAMLSIAGCDGASPTAPTTTPTDSGGDPQTSVFTLSGVVKSAVDDTALAGSDVVITSGANNGGATTTNADGRYEFRDLAAGELTVRASATSFDAQTVTVVLDQDRAADFALAAKPDDPEPRRVSLQGVVLADSGGSGPAGGGTIEAAGVEIISGLNKGRRTTTDAAGRYALADLQPDELTVEAGAPGYLAQSRSLVLDESGTVDFTLPAVPEEPAFATNGRVTHAMSQAGVAGIRVEVDSLEPVTTDAGGAFRLEASQPFSSPRFTRFSGSGFVTRDTLLAVPGDDALVTLIPADFDLQAFNEMFREPLLRRWTSAPPLIVLQRAVEFAGVDAASATAVADEMSTVETDSLLTDLSWALPQLTGGHFSDFAGVTEQSASEGASVTLLNEGSITVVRVVGLYSATGSWGYGRWQYAADGSVTGGLMMLDRDFERSGSSNLRTLRAHELGHALGYAHVSSTASVMDVRARTAPTAFDLAACTIAFQRRPGSRSPDVDPEPGAINAAAGPRVWSRAIK
jgi:hypothetical protein